MCIFCSCLGGAIMKLVVVKVMWYSRYQPMCGTCQFRGTVSTVLDPSSQVELADGRYIPGTRITSVHCNKHDNSTDFYSICSEYAAVSDTLARLFATKRIL